MRGRQTIGRLEVRQTKQPVCRLIGRGLTSMAEWATATGISALIGKSTTAPMVVRCPRSTADLRATTILQADIPFIVTKLSKATSRTARPAAKLADLLATAEVAISTGHTGSPYSACGNRQLPKFRLGRRRSFRSSGCRVWQVFLDTAPGAFTNKSFCRTGWACSTKR